MIRVNNQKNYLQSFIDKQTVDKVYPESIVQNYQAGEVFVDRIKEPNCCLFWHKCRFGYFSGEYRDDFLYDIVKLIRNDDGTCKKRLALQIGNEPKVEKFLKQQTGLKCTEQYLFSFIEESPIDFTLPDGFEIMPIDYNNYGLLIGKITPSFSWNSREEFLENGFGYCILNNGRFVSTAFSAGISDKYVDIGIETSSDYRQQSFGKKVASKIVQKILSLGKIPIWECSVINEASRKTAETIGFRKTGKHSLWISEKQF